MYAVSKESICLPRGTKSGVRAPPDDMPRCVERRGVRLLAVPAVRACEGRGITLLWVRQAKLQAAQPSWPAPSRLNEPRPVAHRPHSPLACDGQAHLVSFVQQCTCHCRYRENRRTRSAACLSLSHLSSSHRHTLTAPHDSTTLFLRKEKTARPSVSLDQLHI